MKNTRNKHSPSRPAPRLQTGFTMIELMVALTLGLILLAAVGQIYVTSRSSYTLQEALGQIQESGRFAMEFLTEDIRMAGYMGCNSSLTSVGTIAEVGGNAFGIALPGGVMGYTYTGSGTTANLSDWTPTLPSSFFNNGDVAPNTDVILIQRGSALNTNLTGNMNTNAANIQIATTTSIAGQLQAGDVLMISDCNNADVFTASNVSNGSGTTTIAHASNTNSTNKLTSAYSTSATIMELVSRAYYIAPGTNTPSGEPSLMRRELIYGVNPPTTQELVQGVENMRILYGVVTPGSPPMVVYDAANAVVGSNWSKVGSVRVGLLLRTPDHVLQNTDTEVFTGGTELVDGEIIPPPTTPDHRRRQVYKSTILIRH
ncbi:MAG: PilW family protein [Sulfuricaulis sp.]